MNKEQLIQWAKDIVQNSDENTVDFRVARAILKLNEEIEELKYEMREQAEWQAMREFP